MRKTRNGKEKEAAFSVPKILTTFLVAAAIFEDGRAESGKSV